MIVLFCYIVCIGIEGWIDLFIFDFDGILVDIVVEIVEVVNCVLVDVDVVLCLQLQIEVLIGVGVYELMCWLLVQIDLVQWLDCECVLVWFDYYYV